MATFQQIFDAPKAIETAKIRQKSHDGHIGVDVRLTSSIEGSLRAVVRVNLVLVEQFSCILVYERPGAAAADLLRVNGDHGMHRNPDGTTITGPHVHLPVDCTAEAFSLGRPSMGIELDQSCALLPFAWQEFCQRVNIAAHDRMAKAVGKLHNQLSQETFDELFDH